LSPTGQRLSYVQVYRCFRILLARVGLPSAGDYKGPSLHDLRHRFAVGTMVRWYRAGVDVDKHILSLSTYLGHVSVENTYWYLTAAPELMGLARGRLELALGRLP
jgi:integrase